MRKVTALLERGEKQLVKYWQSLRAPKRLLVLRLNEEKLQALLLNREKNIYGVEECCTQSLETEKPEEAFEALLTKLLVSWRLEKEKPLLAIWQEELYREEFTLPGLPPKQLQQLIAEEVKARVPMVEGSYWFNYRLQLGAEEHLLQLAAISKERLEGLKRVIANKGLRLAIVAGGSFTKEISSAVEFWNCFCDKAKAGQLQQEYKELLSFGIACLKGEEVINLLPQLPWWKKNNILKPMLEVVGCLSVVMALFTEGYLYWQQQSLLKEQQVLEFKLQELRPWEEKRQALLKLQKELKQREMLYKQIKKTGSPNSYWLELLGKVMPAGCWLTSLEEQEEGFLLRGKALEATSVELLRKQLLSFKECKSCDLLEGKQLQAEKRFDFVIKVKR